MPTNVYFNPGVMSEQRLYEDMIEESLRIYGQDVYYIPRFLKNFDAVLDDAVASEFNQAYFIEMYIDEIFSFSDTALYEKADDETIINDFESWMEN